jgi:hypothetical protein
MTEFCRQTARLALIQHSNNGIDIRINIALIDIT